jgi:archaellum component FlaC
MALTTITLHGQILEPVTNTPAVGTVTFKILHELADNVANIVYAPMTFSQTLSPTGEFSIVLPTTDNPDITPLNWTYWGYVDTDVWNSGVISFSLPVALGPVAEFADLVIVEGSDCTPDGSTCAPIGVVGEITALQDTVDDLQADVTALTADVANLQGQINALATSVGNIASDVVDLEADVTALTTDVTTLQGQMTTVQADVVTLQGQVTTLQGQMTTAQGDITTLQGQVTTLQGQVATLQGQMTTAQGDITTLQGQVTTILANAGLMNPTAFVTLTAVDPNITVATAVPPQSRLDRGAENGRLRGFLQATGAVASGNVLANVTAAHRPLHNVSLGVRYSGGSNRLQIATNGNVTLSAALALNDQVWLDGITWDMLA